MKMAQQIVLDNEWATMVYDSTDKYIYHTIHKHTTGEPMRRLLNAGVDALAQYGAQKWLSDDRCGGETTEEDAKFGATDWGPRAAAAGWKYWALVVPENIAGRASMQGVVEHFFNLGVRVAVFTDVESARAWLVSL